MRSRCSKASWNSTSSSLALRLSWLNLACSASTRALHSRDPHGPEFYIVYWKVRLQPSKHNLSLKICKYKGAEV